MPVLHWQLSWTLCAHADSLEYVRFQALWLPVRVVVPAAGMLDRASVAMERALQVTLCRGFHVAKEFSFLAIWSAMFQPILA